MLDAVQYMNHPEIGAGEVFEKAVRQARVGLSKLV